MGRDGVAGLVLLALSLWLYRHTAEIPRPPFVPLGPDFYPRVLLGVLAGLSLALVGAGFLNRRGGQTLGVLPRGGACALSRYRDVFLTYSVFGAYVVLVPLLGFRTSTTLFVALLSWSLGPKTVRHAILSLVTGLGLAAAVHLVFEVYLRLLLPRGTFL